jgi:hypothetical protein
MTNGRLRFLLPARARKTWHMIIPKKKESRMPVKACFVGWTKNRDGAREESVLRHTGFAAATLSRREVSQPRGRMQLLPFGEDEDIKLGLFSASADESGPGGMPV